MDGIKDSNQANVATFISPITNSYMTLTTTNGCNIVNGVYHGMESQNTTQNPNNDYYIGMHGFVLNCGTPGITTQVTYIWDQLYDTTLWVDYEKYNPNTQQYFSIKNLVNYGVINNRTTASYPITDG
jgi:hypothetical protein